MKKSKENFVLGIMSLMFSQFFIKILGMVHSVYLTNKKGFGDTGNAIYMSGYQIYILVLTICSVGVPNTISKLIAERIGKGDYYNSKRILKVSFYIFGIIGFLGSSFMYFSSSYIANKVLRIPEAEYTLIALAPSIFFVSLNSVFKGYFNGIKKMSIVAKTQFNEQLVKTLVTILLVEIIAIVSKNNTMLMASIANIATTIATIITFIYVIKLYNESSKEIKVIKTQKERIRKIIKQIFLLLIPLSLTTLISALNKNVDSITVVRILNPIYGEELAKVKYGILSTKVDLLTTMPLAFNMAIAMAIIPEISASKINGDIKNIKNKIKTSILISNIIGFPCFLGMFLYSNEIMMLLFPKANLGGELLKIASITIIFSMLIQTISAILQALDHIKYPIISLSIGVILKLILNIILISIKDVYEKGAILSTVISNIIVFIFLFFKLNKECDIIKEIKIDIIKIAFSTIIMGVSSYVINILLKEYIGNMQIVNLFIIGFCVVIYFYMIIKLKIIKIEDFNEYYYKKSEKY